jgi:acyl-[acyl carrier protein]--UDP-N-acetylglucosamine O-acyltransferase
VITFIPPIFSGLFPEKTPISDSRESQKRRIPISLVEFQEIFLKEMNAQRSKRTGAKMNRFHSPNKVLRKLFKYPPTTELASQKYPSTHKKISTTAAIIFFLSALMEAFIDFLLFLHIETRTTIE